MKGYCIPLTFSAALVTGLDAAHRTILGFQDASSAVSRSGFKLGAEKRIAEVYMDRKGGRKVKAGIEDLSLLKTTQVSLRRPR